VGIEFDGPDRHHQDRIESLIRYLGAGENVAAGTQVELRTCRGSASQTAQSTVTPEFHDNLLRLILVGTAPKREDFLRKLEKQRRCEALTQHVDSAISRQ